jgi:hypothetical protein
VIHDDGAFITTATLPPSSAARPATVPAGFSAVTSTRRRAADGISDVRSCDAENQQ